MSCNRCSQSSSTPENFLLLCRSCKKYWHHRCHPPPLEDDDLLRLIRSQNAGDRENGLHGWKCKRCVKNQAAESCSKTAAQSLKPKSDDSNQDPPPFAQTQESLGLALPKDKRKNNSSVATRGGGLAGPSIEATTHKLHTAEPIQHSDHGSQHLQQQGNHTGSQMRSLGAEELRSADKRLQVKRVLQEQHLDGPRVDCDYPINTELCLVQPAVPPSPKYARSQDGKKLVSSEYPPRVERLQVINPLHIKKPVARKADTPSSRSVTLFSERVYSPFTSLPVDEEKYVQSDSAMKSPGGDGQEVGTRIDTPPGNPVGHEDIHMKDETDDLYGPPFLRFSGSTPILSSSKTFSEQQGGSVKQEDRQTVQQQGVFQSHHQLKGQSSLKVGPTFGVQTVFPDEIQQRTAKAEAKPLLGPDWLKARYSFVDDPWRCLCDPQRRMYGGSRRKKCTTKFLGDSAQSVATTDRELLGYLFCHDWIQQTQANIR